MVLLAAIAALLGGQIGCIWSLLSVLSEWPNNRLLHSAASGKAHHAQGGALPFCSTLHFGIDHYADRVILVA